MTDLLDPTFVPTLEYKIVCLQRELQHRARVWPRLIAEEKLDARQAQREYTTLAAILADYARQRQPGLFDPHAKERTDDGE